MDWVDCIGYCGTAFTILAYAMKTSVPLRIAALLSSVAFLAYGWLTASYPVMMTELILLPLNGLRLYQSLALVRSAVRPCDEGGPVALDFLVPHMARRCLGKGMVLFREGDAADTVFVLLSGRVTDGHSVAAEAGTLLGAALPFAAAQQQRSTLIAQTDAVVASVSLARLTELYAQSPAFGIRLAQSQVDNLRAERDKLRARLADMEDTVIAGGNTAALPLLAAR